MPRNIDDLYFGPEGGPPMLEHVTTALKGLAELLYALAVGSATSAELVERLEWAAPKLAEVAALARAVLGGPSL